MAKAKIKTRQRNPNRALTAAQITALLQSLDDVADDALIRLGLSTGLRISELMSIRVSEIDFERGLIRIWDEKKDQQREIMPTLETMAAVRRWIKARPPARELITKSAKTIERMLQRRSMAVLGFSISWHSLRTTYVSRSVELEQSPAVVLRNTGDSPATVLRYYTRLPDVVMRRFVESRPVIPLEAA